MKKELTRNLCKSFGLLVGFLLFSHIIVAQNDRSKIVEESYSVEKGASIIIEHRRGEVRIKRSNNDKIKARLDVSVTGSRAGDLEQLLESIKLKQGGNGNSYLKLISENTIKNWSQVNGKSTVKLEDGTRLKGIKELDMDLEIAIPDGMNIKVSNKYNNIVLEKITANVDVQNYNGDVSAEDIDGDFTMDLKYGKATIGNVGSVDMTLYESVLTMGNAKDLKLNSKYSKHTIGRLANAEMESYEGLFTISKISGDVEIKDKYSEWTMTSFEEGEMTLYESELTIGDFKKIKVDSKYSEFRIGSAETLEFGKSYEDDIEIETLSTLKTEESKYIDIKIGKLKKGIYLEKDHGGDIEVDRVESSFEGMEISGKSTDIELPLEDLKYILDVDFTNGDISLNDEKFEATMFVERSNKTKVKGKMNNANDKSPKVVLKGYDIDVDLE